MGGAGGAAPRGGKTAAPGGAAVTPTAGLPSPCPPRPPSRRVQPKVRRNGRGGWSKQEVRAGGAGIPWPQPSAVACATAGPAAARRRPARREWLQYHSTPSVSLPPAAGRPPAPYGAAVWRQELEEDWCERAAGCRRPACMHVPPRASWRCRNSHGWGRSMGSCAPLCTPVHPACGGRQAAWAWARGEQFTGQ